MQLKDIKYLAQIAQIEISDEEGEGLLQDLAATLVYIDQVKDVVLPEESFSIPEHRDQVREDDVSVVSGSYTTVLVSSAVGMQDNYVKVKKIL